MSNHERLEEINRKDNFTPKRDTAEYMREYRKTEKYKEVNRAKNRKWRLANAEKVKAHILVARALKSGKLVRPTNCDTCKSSTFAEAHHPDYTKPLEVMWLCVDCHKAIHRSTKNAD